MVLRSLMTSLALLLVSAFNTQVVSAQTTSISDLERYAAKGDVGVMYNLVLRFYKGWGGSRSHSKALEWYEKADDQGYCS